MIRFAIPAALVFAPATALAQDAQQDALTDALVQSTAMNPEHWKAITSDEGTSGVFHRQSGAICLTEFRELQLSDVTSYTPDGNDVSCSYTSGEGESQTKLTTYFYKKPGLTGPVAFQGARQQIEQIAQMTELTADHNPDHSQRCHSAVAPLVGQEVAKRPELETGETGKPKFGMGVAVFDYTLQTGFKQTSLLSVYELGGWIMKTRMTLPAAADETAYAKACNYSGLASIATAKLLDIEEADEAEGG